MMLSGKVVTKVGVGGHLENHAICQLSDLIGFAEILAKARTLPQKCGYRSSPSYFFPYPSPSVKEKNMDGSPD